MKVSLPFTMHPTSLNRDMLDNAIINTTYIRLRNCVLGFVDFLFASI